MKTFSIILFCLAPFPGQIANAEEAVVAVATNFFSTAKQIELAFEKSTKHEITLVSGSTGKLYAQILHGAPFHAFLAADRERPQLLEESLLAVSDSQFTYALGQLALATTATVGIHDDVQTTLQDPVVDMIAIANPALAPYGAASRETLEALHLWPKFKDQMALGDNVGQAYAMVATGNVQFGFVALSQVINPANAMPVSYIEISMDLHDPIRQDALLLKHGAENIAARAFLQFLRSDETRALLLENGYGVE